MKKFVCWAALGAVALLVALPAPAAARSYWYRGARGCGCCYTWSSCCGYTWRTYYYYPSCCTSYPYAVYYPVASASEVRPYTAFYPQEQPTEPNAATIRLHVPSAARVWFDGNETAQRGTDRTFVSPALTPGREHVYQLRVQWDDNGKAVERSREVTVHAGERLDLNLDS